MFTDARSLVAQLRDRQRVRDQRRPRSDSPSASALMVRLTPSTVIEPFGTMARATLGRRRDLQSSAPPRSRRATTRAHAVDVAGDQVAAQRIAQPQRTLEVDASARLERPERRERQGLRAEVGGEPSRAERSTTVRQTPSTAMLAPSGRLRRPELGGRRPAEPRRGRARSPIDSTVPVASTMPVNMKTARSIAPRRCIAERRARRRRRVISRSSPTARDGERARAQARARPGAGARRRSARPPPSSRGATNSATRSTSRRR